VERIKTFLINRIKLFKLEYSKLTREQLIISIISHIITHGFLLYILIVYLNQNIILCLIGYSIGVFISKVFIEPKISKFFNISK
jgi:hypothetical protein